MTSLRKDYDLPKRPPLPMRHALVMFALPPLALGLWLALPSSPITVALLAIALLAAVFTGVGLVLSSRELDEKPARDPGIPSNDP
ncbi:MAG: hypothetical protein Q8O56_01905 [Solirubrobacteraceae bacterium]|nr:hypothetical protein [Solirubrobacteraceae bacterium]